jgi:MFS family permease
MNIVFGAGAALGAPLGGIIADHLGWRWAFGIQVPIILLSITMVARFIKVTKTSQNNEEDWKARVRRIDFLGSSMLVSAVSCLIIGLDTGGNLLPWSSPVPLSLIAGTVVLGTCFVLVEIKVASDPILAVRLMRARTPVLTAAANLLTTAAYFIIIFQLPLFYKAVLHLSAGETGRRLIPGAIGGSLGSVSIGLLMSFYGTYYRFMLMCSALLVVGTIFVRSLGLESSLFAQFTVLIPCGIGYGGLLTTTLIALLKAVRKDEMASATGMSYLARATGSILGISVSSNVLNTLLGARLVPVLGKKMTERVKRDAELIWALDKHKRIAVLGIYVDCMHLLFAGAIILSVLGGLCAAAVERKSLKEEDAVVQSST